MVHKYVLQPENLLCFPAQFQECGGGARKQASTLGEVEGAVEGHQPCSKAVICSFAQGRGGAKSEPCKMTSCRPHTCMFYPDCQKQTSRGPDGDKWVLCLWPNTELYLPEKTRIDRFAVGDLLYPQMRAGSCWACVTDRRASRDVEENIVLASLGVDHLGLRRCIRWRPHRPPCARQSCFCCWRDPQTCCQTISWYSWPWIPSGTFQSLTSGDWMVSVVSGWWWHWCYWLGLLVS